MIDFDIVAYAMLGLSLTVSAMQIGRWLLNANPRAILNAGRCSAVALAALTPVALLGLVISGRSTIAIMLAAFILPVFVQGARRWRGWRGPLNALRSSWPAMTPDLGECIRPGSRSGAPGLVDPELAERCAAVLNAYLEQSKRQVERRPSEMHFASGAVSVSGAGRERISAEEALEMLGLDPTASASDIREAYRRLDEARDVLLGA